MKGATFQLKNGAPLEALRFGNSKQALVASNGELNAYSKKDLMNTIGALMAAASQGQIQKAASPNQIALAAERRQILAAALNDAGAWSELGVAIAAEINEAAAREGFLRRLALEEPLSQGQDAKIRVRFPNVVAIVATSAAEVRPQVLNDKYFYPPEFNIIANLEVTTIDQARATGDILDEKYQDGLAAIMVQEDRIWKRSADAAVTGGGAGSNPVNLYTSFTPATLSGARTQVTDWSLPATTAVIANNLWTDISTNNAWQAVFSPVEQSEILLTGKLGTFYGMDIITDGFRRPEQRVLLPGEFYVVAEAQYHAAVTTRGGVVPNPVNGALVGKSTKGWFLDEVMSFFLANPRSVAKGQRQ